MRKFASTFDWAQVDDGCAPTAELRMAEREINHVGIFREQRMDGAAQVADAFAVDDAHLADAATPAFGEIPWFWSIARHKIE